ncbi:sec-independent translocase [Streptomyces sp. NPDC048717]|uniref:sec-independent translocase n=1 Tax=Streptomyces sp. NPDC048717 TaxID=3154928 RepID=UPI00342C5C33
MFSDIGALELVTLVVLAVLIFGPDKLPKLIQDISGVIRKIREFSDSAKADIRSELGPEFKDFEFEDLNPKNFIRKQLAENDDLKELRELRSSFDLRKEMNEVADAVHGRDTVSAPSSSPSSSASGSLSPASDTPSQPTVPAAVNGSPDLLKKQDKPGGIERPPYDSDAT